MPGMRQYPCLKRRLNFQMERWSNRLHTSFQDGNNGSLRINRRLDGLLFTQGRNGTLVGAGGHV